MTQCDYWWSAGGVEWCDMTGSCCKCGGCENTCSHKKHRKKMDSASQTQMQMMIEERSYVDAKESRRQVKHSQEYHR